MPGMTDARRPASTVELARRLLMEVTLELCLRQLTAWEQFSVPETQGPGAWQKRMGQLREAREGLSRESGLKFW